MTIIPNTIRRGAIYWYRRSARLPSGNQFRPTVSLRTSSPAIARRRAAVLSVAFEELYMRLFGQKGRRLALEADSARRIFQREFSLALDALEDEAQQAALPSYEYGDLATFLAVHEEIYRYLAETNCSGEAVTTAMLVERLPQFDPVLIAMVHDQLSRLSAIWHLNLDQTAEALEAQGLDTDIFHMDHGMRLRFEARLAAVREYRDRLTDPAARVRELLSAPASTPTPPSLLTIAPPVPAQGPVPATSPWTRLTAAEAAARFIAENPKLSPSESGRRGAKWTDKTRSQFESAMRLLGKSMGDKPFASLDNGDLKRLLEHFDGLPPNHHKSPRHTDMTLDEICAEARVEVAARRMDGSTLGLNVTTLNRHFRFIRMAHDWLRQQFPAIPALNWKAYSFEDERTAREQRKAFPVDLARKLFRLPPWRGCAGRRHRFKPGREIFFDSFFWVIPIVWYSGMRREEACKLLITDIAQDPDGLWYFDVDVTEAGRIKTTSSRRKIPFAEELIRLGLPEFVEAQIGKGELLLFPELTNTKKGLGETFYRHCWRKLMPLLDADAAGLSLHSMRHTVADELKAAGVPEEVRADLLGHSLETETAGRYSKASRLVILKNAVDQIPSVTQSVQAMRPSVRKP